MDAETREALAAIEGVVRGRLNSHQSVVAALDALSRIEQTLRDLSEKAAALDLAHANAEKLRLAGVDSWDALAERVERAERERDDLRGQMRERIIGERDIWITRAEAAEAESARLRGHLERVLAWEHYDPEYADDVTMREHDDEYDAARAALSPPTDGEA